MATELVSLNVDVQREFEVIWYFVKLWTLLS